MFAEFERTATGPARRSPWNPVGNPLQVIGATSTPTTYEYDALHRLPKLWPMMIASRPARMIPDIATPITLRAETPRQSVGVTVSLGPMADDLSPRRFDEPHQARLEHDDPHRAEILAAHAEAMAKGHDGYLDPVTGLLVFTAAYLAARGTCCDSGCRHCPYVK